MHNCINGALRHTFKVNNKKWFICHGDLLNKKDYGYRFMRVFFRSFISKLLIKILPGSFLLRIGESLSSTESKASQVYDVGQSKESFLKKWRIWLKKFFIKQRDVDVFICGHYHVRVIDDINQVKTVNLGSWLNENDLKYLYTDGEKFEFKSVLTSA